MALTDAEVAKVREHLGYAGASQLAGWTMGYPTLTKPVFLFETQVRNIIPENEPKVRKIIGVLDAIECRMIESATAGYPAVRAEDVEPNRQEPVDLEREFVRWGLRLAELLGCPVSPWAERYKVRGSVGNIRVL